MNLGPHFSLLYVPGKASPPFPPPSPLPSDTTWLISDVIHIIPWRAATHWPVKVIPPIQLMPSLTLPSWSNQRISLPTSSVSPLHSINIPISLQFLSYTVDQTTGQLWDHQSSRELHSFLWTMRKGRVRSFSFMLSLLLPFDDCYSMMIL